MVQRGMCCSDADVMFRKHFKCSIFSPFWYFLTCLITEVYGGEADELYPLTVAVKDRQSLKTSSSPVWSSQSLIVRIDCQILQWERDVDVFTLLSECVVITSLSQDIQAWAVPPSRPLLVFGEVCYDWLNVDEPIQKKKNKKKHMLAWLFSREHTLIL